MKKKQVALLLICMLIFTSVVGCGSKTPTSSDSTSAAGSSTQEATTWKSDSGFPIIKDIAQMPKIKVFKTTNDVEPQKPNENLWMKQATKDTGVSFEWITVPEQSGKEKVQMMLASNDLPDVFWNGVERSQVLQYANSGIFVPTETLVDQYMPNLKKIYDARPQYKALSISPDGHMYGFPRVEEMNGLVVTPGSTYVYKPWLDKLGISMPTTLDGWKDMLYKMKKAGDLNGNGQADEYPLAWEYNEGWDSIFGWVSGCFGQPDISNGFHSLTNHLYLKDGKTVSYAPLEESFKETVQLFHQFYTDGLLDPDSFAPTSTGSSLINQKQQKEVPMLGSFMAWSTDGRVTNPDVAKGYVPVPRIEGPNGKSGFIRNMNEIFTTTQAMITKGCQYPDVVARFVDYIMQPEQSVTANWGALGAVYVKANDGVLRWDLDESTGNTLKPKFDLKPWQLRGYSTIGGPNIVLSDYYDKVVEYPLDARTVYNSQVAGGKKELLQEYTPVSSMVWFLTDEQAQLDQLLPQINNVVDSAIQTWIIDGGVDKQFDKFKKDLEEAGLNTFLETYQKAYDRYNENMSKMGK